MTSYSCVRSTPLALATTVALIGLASAYSAQSLATIEFEDATPGSGLTHKGMTFGAAWGDLNGDNLPDIFVSNHQYTPPALWLNLGNGKFVDTGKQVLTWVKKPYLDTHGGTWADIDNDGDKDLFVGVGNLGVPYVQQLMMNDRGMLVDSDQTYHMDYRNGSGRLQAWIDYDKDGWLDLFAGQFQETGVVRNLGHGTAWAEVTDEVGVDCDQHYYTQLLDVDHDGQSDVICSGVSAYPQKVYSMTTKPFGNITSMLPSVRNVADTAVADFDGDLRNDLFHVRGTLRPSAAAMDGDKRVEAMLAGGMKKFSFATTGTLTVEFEWSLLWREKRDWTDVIIGAANWHPSGFPFTLDPNDPKNWGQPKPSADQDVTIAIGFDKATGRWTFAQNNPPGTRFSDTYFLIASTEAVSNLTIQGLWTSDAPQLPALVMNRADGFKDESKNAGFTQPLECVSTAAGDFDNDMDVDIYLACRNGAKNLPNVLYENTGDGHFVEVPNAGGAPGPLGLSVAEGAGTADSVVSADYDGDGFLDLFVTNGFNLRPIHVGAPTKPTHNTGGPDHLIHNKGNANAWIELDLVATASARDAITARVYAIANGKTQFREQIGGYHRWSQDHTRIHFGLADAATVDLIVEWPSGSVENFTGVDVKKIYRVTEGSGLSPVVLGDALPYPCGVPSYNIATESGALVWKDCTTGAWQVRLLSAGATRSYTGTMTSSAPFQATTRVKLETSDLLTSTATPAAVTFAISTTAGDEDEFSALPLNNAATTCFDINLPAGTTLQFGLLRKIVTPPFNVETLQPCTP